MRKILINFTITLITVLSIFSIMNLKLVKYVTAAATLEDSNKSEAVKRGTPPFDYIIGSDGLPHYRVLFWVPLNAKNYRPFAAEGVITNVSHHGPVENWTVVETKTRSGDEKLVFIYVPKTFVFLSGSNFYKVIYLSWICP